MHRSLQSSSSSFYVDLSDCLTPCLMLLTYPTPNRMFLQDPKGSCTLYACSKNHQATVNFLRL